MKKILVVLLISGAIQEVAAAQTANDLVQTWLSLSGITATDYRTCDPAELFAIVGTDGLCRWGADLGPQPTKAQLLALTPAWQAQQQLAARKLALPAALTAGVALISASTPALNGTYAIDGPAQQEIMAEVAYFSSFGTFSNGGATLQWPVQGGSVTISSQAQLLAIAKGTAQYVTAWKQYANGITDAAPTSPVQIP